MKLIYVAGDPLADIEQRDFIWLMRSLTSPYEHKLHGCEVHFPDTAFIDVKGKVTEIIKTDKDGFLVSVKNPQKLKQQSLRRNFTTIVRDRRRQPAV